MSRGISWRQRMMLKSIAHHTKQTQLVRVGDEFIREPCEEPVAWRSIDRGSGGECPDYFTPRAAWNREQVTRRALRSLERRGLVTLDRYLFCYEPFTDGMMWTYRPPDQHDSTIG